jgi:hypothetical protein
MPDQPQLVLCPLKGETIRFICSRCQQLLILPDDVPARQAMAELWAAFQDHVSEIHLAKAPASALAHSVPAGPAGPGTAA